MLYHLTPKLLGLAAGTGLAASAMAADLSLKDDPPEPDEAPLAFHWSGFYAGAQLGYGRLRQTDDVIVAHRPDRGQLKEAYEAAQAAEATCVATAGHMFDNAGHGAGARAAPHRSASWGASRAAAWAAAQRSYGASFLAPNVAAYADRVVRVAHHRARNRARTRARGAHHPGYGRRPPPRRHAADTHRSTWQRHARRTRHMRWAADRHRRYVSAPHRAKLIEAFDRVERMQRRQRRTRYTDKHCAEHARATRHARATYDRTRSDITTLGKVPGFQTLTRTDHGLIAGGHFGGLLQIYALIVGVEGRFDAAALALDAVRCAAADTLTCATASKVNWLGAGIAKIGLAHDRWMVYGSLGFARAKIGRGAAGASEVINGRAYGGGLSYALSRQWMLSADYLHYDMQDRSVQRTVAADAASAGATLTARQDVQFDVFTARLSYRFGH